jgi:hypothetical protein
MRGVGTGPGNPDHGLHDHLHFQCFSFEILPNLSNHHERMLEILILMLPLPLLLIMIIIMIMLMIVLMLLIFDEFWNVLKGDCWTGRWGFGMKMKM